MNSKTMTTVAAVAAAAAYMRWAVRPVSIAFRAGKATAELSTREDVRTLGRGLADAVGMLREAGIWQPKGARPADDADAPAA
jgi:hypothetical protein